MELFQEESECAATMKNLFMIPKINDQIIEMLTGLSPLQIATDSADSTRLIKKELQSIESAGWSAKYAADRDQAFKKINLYRFLFPRLKISTDSNLINNYRPAMGNKPLLHEAIRNNTTKQICFLLNHGANIEILDKDGEPPVCFARNQNKTAIMKLLLDRGANASLLKHNPHSYYGD